MTVSPRKIPLLVAGVAYAVGGLISLRHTQAENHWSGVDRAIEAAFAVALVASVLALPAVRHLTTSGRAGAVGARVAAAGFGALFVASVVSLGAGRNELGPLFVLGLLAALVGLATLAVAGVRDRRLRWPAPMLLAAFLVGMALGDSGGELLIGAAWLGIAWLVVDEPVAGAAATPAGA